MSDKELLEMAYTIMERIKLQRGISLDSYTGTRLHEWLRRYKNRPTQRVPDFVGKCAICSNPTEGGRVICLSCANPQSV